MASIAGKAASRMRAATPLPSTESSVLTEPLPSEYGELGMGECSRPGIHQHAPDQQAVSHR